MRRPLLVLGLLCAGGCGLSHTVDRELLRSMTIEHKLKLFDAENELSIALDDQEELRQRVAEVKQDLEDADRLDRDARADAARAKAKGDKGGADLSRLTGSVYGLKRSYLEAQLDYERGRLEVQRYLVTVARARFELAKATLVKNNNLRGASDIEVADFEKQVDETVEDARKAQAALKKSEKALDAAKRAWLAKRDELQSASKGALGNPWLEDAQSWE